MSLMHRILPGLVIITCFVGVGFAQTATLDGVVKDQTGAIIPGVTVTLTNEGTNISVTSITNDAGRYLLVNLQPGFYTLSAELQGFKRYVRKAIQLQVGDALTANVDLSLGEVSQEVVEVTGTVPAIDLTGSKIGAVVQRQAITDLPLNGRNALDLYYLQAGTNPIDRVGGSGSGAGSVDGLRTNSNNLKVEGVWAQDATNDGAPSTSFIPTPLEAVGEYRVTTSSAAADTGRGAGAQVMVLFKSGTNQFHGSAFEFNRNTVYNANNWFSNRQGSKRPIFQRNQFGFSVGGPVIKDKTFFFTTVEWQRENQQSIQNKLVYTSTLRNGIFRFNKTDRNRTSNVDSNGNPTIPASSIGTIDLLSVDSTRLGFDPTGKVATFFKTIQLPNNYDIGDGFNLAGFRFNASDPTNGSQYLIKVDHQFNSNNQLRASYSFWQTISPGVSNYPGYYPNQTNANERRGVTLGWTSTLKPTLISEFVLGGYRKLSDTDNGDPASKDHNGIFNLRGLGLSRGGDQNGNLTGIYQRQASPLVAITATESMTWIKKNHTFKWGVEIIFGTKFSIFGGDYWIPVVDTLNSGNPATIPSLTGLNSNDRISAQQLTNDLTGSVGFIQQDFLVSWPVNDGYRAFSASKRYWSQPEYGAFFQDTWKARPNLTVSYGVRYDLLLPCEELNGVYSQPKYGPASTLGMTASRSFPAFTPKGVSESGFAPNKGRGIVNLDTNNFGPNIGFVWDPTKKGRTSISGNFRVAFDRHMLSVYGRFDDTNQGLNYTILPAIKPGLRFGTLVPDVMPVPVPQAVVNGQFVFPALPYTRQGTSYTINPNTTTPYTESWSLRIQHEVFNNWTLEAAYVGNGNVGGWRGLNVNQINIKDNGFLDGFLAAQRNLAANANPNKGESIGVLATVFAPMGGIPSAQNTVISTGQVASLANYADTTTFNGVRGGLITAAKLPLNFFRGNPQVENAQIVDNLSHSTYHGLKLQLNRRFEAGLFFQANYTLGKGLTDYQGGQGQANDYRDNDNRNLDKTFFVYDSRHIVNINGLYELPVGRGKRWGTDWNRWANAILGGWQTNGIFQYASGRPFTVATGRYTYTLGDASTTNYSGTDFAITAKVIKGPNSVTSLTDQEKALFTNPGAGSVGGTPQTAFRNPSYSNLDLSIFKNFPLRMVGEQGKIQFRAELFNMLNHASFNGPSGNINSGDFGVISSTRGAARVGQFALKIIF